MTEQQEKFCSLFVDYGCDRGKRADAYLEAGFKIQSRKSASNSAGRLLENVGIQKRIKEICKQRAKETKKVAEKQHKRKIMDATNRRIKLTEIAESGKSIVAIKAIDVLNKMDGMYINKVEVSGEIGIVDALKDARERLKDAKK